MFIAEYNNEYIIKSTNHLDYRKARKASLVLVFFSEAVVLPCLM